MHFGRSRTLHKPYKPCAGRTSYDRVVHEYNALTLYRSRYGIELYLDLILSYVLTGCNKGPANIFVLYESDAIRDAGLLGISDRRVKTRVGYADNDVSLYAQSFRGASAPWESHKEEQHISTLGIATALRASQ